MHLHDIFVSFITGYTNDNLSKEWIRSKNRFDVIDYLIEHNVFDKIPEMLSFIMKICIIHIIWKMFRR